MIQRIVGMSRIFRMKQKRRIPMEVWKLISKHCKKLISTCKRVLYENYRKYRKADIQIDDFNNYVDDLKKMHFYRDDEE